MLGRMAVATDDGPIEISGRQRTLLALLLVSAPNAVNVEKLVDEIYREQTPSDPEVC